MAVAGVYPPDFACPEGLLEEVWTNYDYGTFAAWGELAADGASALCLRADEGGKMYLTCVVAEEGADLRAAAEFLALVGPKLALAASLDRLEDDLPRLAPVVLDHVEVGGQTPARAVPLAHVAVLEPGEGEVKICPFRMSLPEGAQSCLRERCMAFVGDGCYLIHGDRSRRWLPNPL